MTLKTHRYISVAMTAAALSLAATYSQAEDTIFKSLDGSAQLSGGVGFKNITANELVYTTGGRLSQLIWTSRFTTVLSSELKVNLDSGWVFRAGGSVGFAGNGHMVDYDWDRSFVSGTGDDEWSDRSIHPDTRLNQFFEASVEAGREIYGNSSSNLDVTAGFKFTNVKWTAWGGSYVYSNAAFRDSSGDFAASQKGITFEQRLPIIFAGLNGETQNGNWTFSSKLRGGITVGAQAIDNHWQRNLRFHDSYYIAPVLAGEASAEYRFNPSASAFISANFEKVFRARGDTREVNTSTNAVSSYSNSIGGDFESIGLSVGLKGKF